MLLGSKMEGCYDSTGFIDDTEELPVISMQINSNSVEQSTFSIIIMVNIMIILITIGFMSFIIFMMHQ